MYAALQMPFSGLLVTQDNSDGLKTYLGYFRQGHFNPATSLACAMMKQIDWTTGAYFAAAQLTGGVVGALMLWLMWFPLAPPGSQLGATVVNSDTSVLQALSTEIMLSYVFHMVLLGLSAVHNHAGTGSFAARCGLELTGVKALTQDTSLVPMFVAFVKMTCLTIGISISGGSLNPARSFGPAVVSGYFEHHWIYWLGPMMGAALAAVTLSSIGGSKRN
jgi:glycerol uptake facilitator-like aquaporin